MIFIELSQIPIKSGSKVLDELDEWFDQLGRSPSAAWVFEDQYIQILRGVRGYVRRFKPSHVTWAVWEDQLKWELSSVPMFFRGAPLRYQHGRQSPMRKAA